MSSLSSSTPPPKSIRSSSSSGAATSAVVKKGTKTKTTSTGIVKKVQLEEKNKNIHYEFGGPIGTFFIIIGLPVVIFFYILYVIKIYVIYHHHHYHQYHLIGMNSLDIFYLIYRGINYFLLKQHIYISV